MFVAPPAGLKKYGKSRCFYARGAPNAPVSVKICERTLRPRGPADFPHCARLEPTLDAAVYRQATAEIARVRVEYDL